ncbi:MAG: ATP-binding protein, partial [Cyclobacteriaceae bacterium]
MEIEYIESNNYRLLQPMLEKAYKHNQFMIVIGDSGWGKSWNFKVFGQKMDNVYRSEISSTMDTNILFKEILKRFKKRDRASNRLFYAIQNVSKVVKDLKSKSMYIIDEAGHFKMSMQRHIRDFRELTKDHSALVISGPYSFYDDLERYAENNRFGIKEILSRVNRWVFLEKPSKEEMIGVFKVNGF